ncbi:MAG: lipoprotein-releasing ABC transporter permease subunit LolE [Flammeovirgaceae bacterium]
MLNTPFFIAKRYFTFRDKKQTGKSMLNALMVLFFTIFTFSPQKIRNRWNEVLLAFVNQNFIRILSRIAMFGVGVGTAAMVIVLSVFNGLEDLTKSLFRSYNPDLKITPVLGKSFELDSLTLLKIAQTEGVQVMTEVIEDNALLRYYDRQKVVMLKGVSHNFFEQYRLDTLIVVGEPVFYKGSVPMALLGVGVYYELSVNLKDDMVMMQAWYPKRDKKTSLNLENAFNRLNIFPSGVFTIDPQYDQQYVIVSLDFASDLLEYGKKRTSIEIRTISKDKEQIANTQKRLKELLGNQFEIKTIEEQQAHILRAIKIERLFVMVAFVFILGIASFNVFFSLTMLAVEKKKDLAIMYAMGANAAFAQKIFYFEGALIALSGTFLGLLAGFLICFLQQQFGFITLGIEGSFTSAYPVRMDIMDFSITGFVMLIITFLASFMPAYQAKKIVVREML